MAFIHNHTGELAALMTALFWTVSSLTFESASRQIGSMAVNIIKLALGFIFLTIYNLITRNLVLPVDASLHNWLWLSVSGLIGFVLGDLTLFKAYTIIGSRFSMLIMTLVPPITTLFSWIMLGERLKLIHFIGMTLTFSGIAMAVFNREGKGERFTLKLARSGIFFAFLGAVGQALGLVLSKVGMQEYDPFAATQIRIIAGFMGYAMLATIFTRWKQIFSAIGNREGIAATALGSVFGPFLGVSFSLISVRYTEAGIASTIMALVPVLIIPPAILLYKQKVTVAEIIGAIISVGGVAVFFL